MKIKFDAILWTIREADAITIKDEWEIKCKTNILNFIWADVSANCTSWEARIYIPAVQFASHLTTTDWEWNCIIWNISTSNRYIANPWDYKIWDWNAWEQHQVIKTQNLIYRCSSKFSFIKDSKITVEIYDDDWETVISSNEVILWEDDIDDTSNNIQIKISNVWDDYWKLKWNFYVSVWIWDILPDWWRFSLKIIHDDLDDWIFKKEQNDVFYDNQVNTAWLSWLTLEEWDNIIINKKSWVSYYWLDTEFKIDIWDIDNLNWISYPTTQVQINGNELWLPTLSLKWNELEWWTNDYNDVDDTYHKDDWKITWTVCHVWWVKAYARTYDWSYSAYANSNILNVCINTMTDNSSRIFEDFKWEDSRLESDFETEWDSEKELWDWELQVCCSKLFYPHIDYTDYLPNNWQPDYSGYTWDRWYYRVMNTTWDDKSNWVFKISGNITEDDIADNNVVFWMSYNWTDFYNMNKDYEWGELHDWDWCRADADEINLTDNWRIKFTFWSGWSWDKCYIKIMMPEWSNVTIDKIELEDWA